MTQDAAPDHDLEALLNLDGWAAEVGGGFWVSVTAIRVSPDQGRPQGISYSLTLHRPAGERVLGYDNAHYPPIGSGPARKSQRARRGQDTGTGEIGSCGTTSNLQRS